MKLILSRGGRSALNSTVAANGPKSGSTISPEQERRLALAVRDHKCAESREALITANQRLVVSIAARYMNRGIPMDDLIAEGNLGLIRAVDSYDPDVGARFSTYAVYWIAHGIVAAFVRESGGARLTRGERSDRAAVEKARSAFAVRHGRVPSNDELAHDLDWTLERVAAGVALVGSRRRPVSLGEMPIEQVAQAPASPAGAAREEGPSARVAQLLAVLSPLDREIMTRRYGLDGGEPAPMRSIARALKLSPRIVRIRFEASVRRLGRVASAQTSRDSDAPIADVAAA